jgi:glycosyltransferase involved in cell wall biosynthesis
MRSDSPEVITQGSTTKCEAEHSAVWPVMVLAHNEEKHIAACLDSLFNGEPDRRLEVYVMANGCTDRTETITRQYALKRPEVHLISIRMPDKCNAWNVFIHEVVPSLPKHPLYFFMDGDARILPGSLTGLAEGLTNHPAANAASAPPASGRSIKEDRRILIEERHLVANLYALRGSFVDALQAKEVRLPLGLEGDDGLLGALIKWNLDPANNGFDEERIIPCAETGFVFDSVSILSAKNWLGYWRRLVRYGRRRYEFQLLGKRLRRLGLLGLPVHIAELYPESSHLGLIWNGAYTIPNWVALRTMRRHTR